MSLTKVSKPKWYDKNLTDSLKVYWWTDTEEELVSHTCPLIIANNSQVTDPHKTPVSGMFFSTDFGIFEKREKTPALNTKNIQLKHGTKKNKKKTSHLYITINKTRLKQWIIPLD